MVSCVPLLATLVLTNAPWIPLAPKPGETLTVTAARQSKDDDQRLVLSSSHGTWVAYMWLQGDALAKLTGDKNRPCRVLEGDKLSVMKTVEFVTGLVTEWSVAVVRTGSMCTARPHEVMEIVAANEATFQPGMAYAGFVQGKDLKKMAQISVQKIGARIAGRTWSGHVTPAKLDSVPLFAVPSLDSCRFRPGDVIDIPIAQVVFLLFSKERRAWGLNTHDGQSCALWNSIPEVADSLDSR